MCFYADTATAIVMYFITRLCVTNMKEESINPIKSQIMGIFGHGCGHLYLAFNPITTQTAYETNGDDKSKHVLFMAIFFFFWYGLTMDDGIMAFGKIGHFFFALLQLVISYFFLKGIYGLGYVSAVIVTTHCLTYLTMKEKPTYYNSNSLVNVPIIIT